MKFAVDDVEYEFIQSPTFGEARAIEKKTGVAFAAMGDLSKMSMDVMQAMVWVSMKRKKPEITFEDLDDLDIGVLSALQGDGDEEAPEVPTVADVDSKAGTISALSA